MSKGSFGPVGAAIGLAGAVVGAVAAGAAAGVAAERYVVKRRRRIFGDPLADEPFGALPYDAKHTVTTAEGVDLYVEVVEPAGEPVLTVVFVHGFCLDMGTWHFQRRALTGSIDPRVRMVFYDQPGHGRSSPHESGDYTLDQLGADLAAVVDAVAPEGPLVLAGHSMGGMAVMALAEQRPALITDRVVGAVFVSTSAGHLDDVALGLPPLLARFRGPLTPVAVRALQWQPGVAEYGRRASSDLVYLLTKRYGFGTSHPSPSLVEYVERMNSSTSVSVVAGYLKTLSDHDRYAALEAFADIETLVVGGDRDVITPIEHTREIARLLPHATLVEVPRGGHCALMEYADVVNDALRDLLRRAAAVAVGEASAPSEREPERAAARTERRAKAVRSGPEERDALRRILRRKGA